MNVWPLNFRETKSGIIFSNDAGAWFRASSDFLERYATGQLTAADARYLLQCGLAFQKPGDLYFSSHAYRWSVRRTSVTRSLDYLILVPTLRCNLSCNYCQVSRAAEAAIGYDWDQETLNAVLRYLDGLTTDRVQIEFQGGEPLLRLDILRAVREFCRTRFKESQFVVCSNFQVVDDGVWDFFSDSDTHLSTSIDGDVLTHTRQRTGNIEATFSFLANVEEFVSRFGSGRVSALPTIDPMCPPELEDIINSYQRFGLGSIYLRPINRQGFARRRPEVTGELDEWNTLHSKFVDLLIEWNWQNDGALEEYYFTHILRRVLCMDSNAHVDIRNPNPVGTNYLVIDFDGKLYPTDEARMMSRVGQIDLSIGDVLSGENHPKITQMNSASFNDLDPDCQHCAYQPFCGVDMIDDISRYGRVDLPRQDTYFCRRHLALFDKAFEIITSTDEKVQHSLKKWLGVAHWPEAFAEIHL